MCNYQRFQQQLAKLVNKEQGRGRKYKDPNVLVSHSYQNVAAVAGNQTHILKKKKKKTSEHELFKSLLSTLSKSPIGTLSMQGRQLAAMISPTLML